MRGLMLAVIVAISHPIKAQHCPWDCSGMLLLQTEISHIDMKQMNPLLVDKNKKVIIDTVYGTGKETFDTCRLFDYDDFIAYRVSRITTHHWYSYDTMLHFAKDKHVIRYNYCKYNKEKLFLQLTAPDKQGRKLYIEIPDNSRIHLHQYNNGIRNGLHQEIMNAIQPTIFYLRKKDLKF